MLPFPPFLSSLSFSPSLSLSFSLFPSLLPSSFNRLRVYSSIDSLRKKKTPSSRHRAFICSPDLERICIRANRLWLVRDHPTLHIVLEATISVSCFYSTDQTRPCTLWISRYVASITFPSLEELALTLYVFLVMLSYDVKAGMEFCGLWWKSAQREFWSKLPVHLRYPCDLLRTLGCLLLNKQWWVTLLEETWTK